MSQGGCYCCNPVSTGMDVDSALHELGMISSVTNSRREYLHERNRTCVKEPASSRFRILRIDPTYVTGFSSSTSTDPGSPYKQDQDSSLQLPAHSQPTTGHSKPTLGHSQPIVSTEFGTSYRNPEEEAHVRRNMKCRMTRMSRLRAGRYQRFRKPYEVPWRINQSLPETELRQTENEYSQSKSNSSSPVKAFSETSLTRSRSLGNLDLAKLSLNDFLEKKVTTTEKEEMERVSSHLENLHVTETS
ncbi:uncharacterized protein LOC133191392 [Saccostrea echinata]|uniref:uncharacterized protein LOC133191392 n=1 Tax=Saccostrea echinata TaxID=191078 RepID=UPI002A82DAA2|nr:uncharacterized protein LOC133191392 [Saccostrea echinata]XP_061183131.1 uncharacterized protein LOC133191392 [Saccostrea echinata]